MLTKVHEELQPKLKEMRQRFDQLLLERSQRKVKSARRRLKVPHFPVDNPCTQCLGGKAGIPFFIIQVGEIDNLYKTRNLCSNNRSMPTLDLHGYTREQALVKLDENLKIWVDTAMKGAYPFVIVVHIICGCGNLLISESVQKWIKSREKVRNAPKNAYLMLE